MGNVVLWKPSPMAILSNYFVMEIFQEAGLPPGVIQFLPGPASEIVGEAIKSPDFASLHFTGSTHVFKGLWKEIGLNVDHYRSYPRIGTLFFVLPFFLDSIIDLTFDLFSVFSGRNRWKEHAFCSFFSGC